MRETRDGSLAEGFAVDSTFAAVKGADRYEDGIASDGVYYLLGR